MQKNFIMPTTLILSALAILPVVLLSIYVYRKDKFGKEPFGMLLKTFFFGCLSVIPAVILEGFLMGIHPATAANGSVLSYSLYHGFVVAGFSEELSKLLLLALAVWRSRHFNEYFDGIVYAAFLSLGFAGVENFTYVFGQDDLYASLHTALLRAAVSVPGHFLFGVAMGYYFALAKFEPAKRMSHLAKALLVPLVLHGTFDALIFSYSLFSDDRPVLAIILFIAFIFFDIKIWKAGKRKLNKLQMKSEVQHWENYQYTEGDDGENG